MSKIYRACKKLLCFVLVLTLMNSVFICSIFAEENDEDVSVNKTVFVDVPENIYYTEAVYFVNEKGIMNGTATDKFSPLSYVTRQQVWMCLGRLQKANPATMEDARLWAIEKGISDGTNPTANISRQEFAKMLYTFAFNFGYDTSKSGSLITYYDGHSVKEWAEVGFQWAVGNGYINGVGGNMIDPYGTLTRAQFATIMMRFMQDNP